MVVDLNVKILGNVKFLHGPRTKIAIIAPNGDVVRIARRAVVKICHIINETKGHRFFKNFEFEKQVNIIINHSGYCGICRSRDVR